MKQKLLFLIASIIFTGCAEKGMFEKIHLEVNTSLPIGTIFFSDSTLFALAGDFSSQLYVGADKVLAVDLKDSLVLANESDFNEIFRFPTQNTPYSLTIGTFIPAPNNMIKIPAGTRFSLGIDMPSGERVDSAIFKTGAVQVNIATAGDMSGVDVTIPQIKNKITGVPVKFKANQTFTLDKRYAFTPINGDEIAIELSGFMPIVPSLTGNFILSLDGLQYAKGFFGRKKIVSPSVTISTTEDFQQFADMIDYLYFRAPSIKFKIRNQYNAPMLLTIDTLEISGTKVQLKEGFNQFFVGALKTTNLEIRNANTVGGNQLSSLIDQKFKSFKVDVNAIMNPSKAEVGAMDANYVEPTFNSFSVGDSLFGTYSAYLPIDGVMENVHFEQELSLDLSSLNSEENKFKEFAFAFSGKNYMPFDIEIDAFVYENDEQSSGAKIKLFEKPILIPASKTINQVNATPFIIDATNRQIVSIKKDVLDRMLASKKIFLALTTSTKNAAERVNVKIFSPSSLDLSVQVGAKVDLLITQ